MRGIIVVVTVAIVIIIISKTLSIIAYEGESRGL